MLLGEKIRDLRIGQGLSQEALAAHLGVSRQAVSKWEKNLSYPDTENLLALAALFGVSSDELAGIKQESSEPTEQMIAEEAQKKKHWTPVRIVILVVLLVFLLFVAVPMFLYTAFRYETVGPTISTDAVSDEEIIENQVFEFPTAEKVGELALIWEEGDGWDYLSITNPKDTVFPFGTTLVPTEREEVLDTDFRAMKVHRVSCGSVMLEYLRITEEGSSRDALSRADVIVPGYETPRSIAVGSDEQDVLEAYGDELVYVMKETGEDILCVHDHQYVYSPYDAGGAAVVFYIDDGHVAGIRIHAGDDRGNEAYAVDHMNIFPIKNGEVDFGERQEPEKEQIDETRAVYIALYALNTDANLSAEEVYTHTATIYSNLQALDWQEFGRMGEAGKEEQTREELLGWLMAQRTLSADSIQGLLLGACYSNLDGWLTDSYACAMARAFVSYPEEYVRILAGERFSDTEREWLISLTGYGSEVPEDFHEDALAAMKSLTGDPLCLSEDEWVWGEMLRDRLE